MPKYEPIAIEGVELRREGDDAVVLVEVGGEYVEILREPLESNFDHHVTCIGIRSAVYGDKSAEVVQAGEKQPYTFTWYLPCATCGLNHAPNVNCFKMSDGTVALNFRT